MKKQVTAFLSAALILSTTLSGGCGGGNTTSKPVTTATTFVFATQPAGAAPGKPFATQPVVSVTDDYGNVMPGWSDPVTLIITAGTGATGAKLSGMVTVSPAQGKVTYADLSIDLAGPVYRLTATSGNLRPASSVVFAVAVPPPPSSAPATTGPTAPKTT
jgi:hypothetical protein